jgi:hypothetical protein
MPPAEREDGEDMEKTAPTAAGSTIAAAHRALGELVRGGASPAEIERFIISVFIERNRLIRNTDFQRLDPGRVTEDYLKPRAELYRFVIEGWIKLIFLPSLKPRVAEKLFVFGLGRLFSSYNDMGVQHSTDVDLNIVTGNDLSKAELAALTLGLQGLNRRLAELFGIELEINPAYTVLRAKEIAAKLVHEDEEIREANLRFYKSNERSISVIKDHAEIREGLFSLVRSEPDARIFENFLGLEGGKPSYAKLRCLTEPLPIIAEGGERVLAVAVIGSKPFAAWCRRSLPRGHFLSPPDWVFSMKYFVNRVYDYVGAMRCQGYSLEAIGLDTEEDPDFRFLRNAHKLMLYLQELITLWTGSFGGPRCDYSYISRSRFLRFMETNGDKFADDFEGMVLKGKLLLPSDMADYKVLRAKIASKSGSRFLELSSAELSRLPEGFAYETVHRDDYCARLCIPYSWADLGFFVFSRIAARIARIVDSRLLPRLPSFGMGSEEYRRYSERFGCP